MPRPRPPYLHKLTTRHGKTTWVVQLRRGAPKIRINETYGSPAFWESYDDAVESAPTRPTPKIRASSGTFEWAWISYKQSGAWAALSPATQKQRENIMKHVLASAGALPITKLNAATIGDGIDRRAATASQAKNFLQTMSQWCKWLAKSGKLPSDPTVGLTVKRKKSQGFLPWAYEHVIAYENRWPIGTRERVMLDVYMYTGLRRGDAARVGPGHVRMSNGEEIITLATEKSQGNTFVHLPLLPVLKRTLEASPIGKRSWIAKQDGLPYTKESLGNMFKDACVEAGILDRSAHGLRKAAATRAAENGATAHQLMAIFGWVDIKEAEIYTRAADRKRLAGEAMNKLEA